MNRSIVWFRNDLRLHDNEALVQALDGSEEIIPVYIFDERVFQGKTSYGFPKTGKYRTKFIIEAINDLRKNIQEKSSDLVVRVGKPEEIIAEIARNHGARWVYCNRERTKEEVDVQDALEKALWTIGVEMRYTRGKMLYYTSDLPFPITHSPDQFTLYRKEVEKIVSVREPLPTPQGQLKVSFEIDYGTIPTLSSFGFESFEVDKGLSLVGGETAGLKELTYYLDSGLVRNYKETRNGLLGRDYSSKFSAFLSQGCLSPKMIFQKLKQHELENGDNDSTYWLFFELLWRDFFRLVAKKYENRIFFYEGIKGKNEKPSNEDSSLFNIWKEGRTGVPFIDANMRELNQTGFMSNRGRQNVASFLIHELGLNWIMGAEYFESLLIDYDPCSNYGNWNYLAGVGTDPRPDRHFNIKSQSHRYDPAADFIKYWLPEISKLPTELLHDLSSFSKEAQNEYGVILGKDYPNPVVNL